MGIIMDYNGLYNIYYNMCVGKNAQFLKPYIAI
jgi:hypothetical protein